MFQVPVTCLFNNKAPVDMGSPAGTGLSRTSSAMRAPLNPSLHGVGIVGPANIAGFKCSC
jgi:hypothetical protein